MDTNPLKTQYRQAVQLLFQTYGDTCIKFSDNINKVGSVWCSRGGDESLLWYFLVACNDRHLDVHQFEGGSRHSTHNAL